jgi:four helix bundle protein
MSGGLKIQESSYQFSIRIVNLYKYLTEKKKEFVISKQLLRSGTAVGALVREAQNAESKLDFIHKLGVAQKECDESIYWLELLRDTEFITIEQYSSMSSDAAILLKMIKSAILTTKQKYVKKNS